MLSTCHFEICEQTDKHADSHTDRLIANERILYDFNEYSVSDASTGTASRVINGVEQRLRSREERQTAHATVTTISPAAEVELAAYC